jgi:hypothetical protein
MVYVVKTGMLPEAADSQIAVNQSVLDVLADISDV